MQALGQTLIALQPIRTACLCCVQIQIFVHRPPYGVMLVRMRLLYCLVFPPRPASPPAFIAPTVFGNQDEMLPPPFFFFFWQGNARTMQCEQQSSPKWTSFFAICNCICSPIPSSTTLQTLHSPPLPIHIEKPFPLFASPILNSQPPHPCQYSARPRLPI